ncbi:MAG: hypothetical protein JNL56_10725 [Alphaproteobacteria bacterium]|nr:hypothetical protein [Alphaproteobacteria bacterium]
MKRLLLAGAAAVALASTASAFVVNIPVTQGNFFINVNGIQPLVCRIDYGATSGNATLNFTLLNAWSITWANLDTNNDAILDNGKTASLALNQFICNTQFTVAVQSANLGMDNVTNPTVPTPGFTNTIDYSVNFPGLFNQNASTMTGVAVPSGPVATSGSVTVNLINSGLYLIAGGYSDVVTITINPSV